MHQYPVYDCACRLRLWSSATEVNRIFGMGTNVFRHAGHSVTLLKSLMHFRNIHSRRRPKICDLGCVCRLWVGTHCWLCSFNRASMLCIQAQSLSLARCNEVRLRLACTKSLSHFHKYHSIQHNTIVTKRLVQQWMLWIYIKIFDVANFCSLNGAQNDHRI